MLMTLTVTDLEGNEREVTAGFKEQIAYEQHTGKTITGWKANVPGLYDFAVLAWIAETGQSMPFAVWTDSVSMVMFDGVQSVDPTKPGASPG